MVGKKDDIDEVDIAKERLIKAIENAGLIDKVNIDAIKKSIVSGGPPKIIEATSLGSSYRTFITDIPDYSTCTVGHPRSWPRSTITANGRTYPLDWNGGITLSDTQQKIFKIKELTGNDYDKKIASALYDDDSEDLCTEHILTMVEIMKAKLMCKTCDVLIDHFECKMTPEVRKIIVKAWKKLDMYGKEPPFIPRCDEYMNMLPEKFNVAGGLLVKMIDPKEYGELYFELDAIQKSDWTLINDITGPEEKSYSFKEDKSILRFEDDSWLPF